ncbi:MAG: hypothetical protein COA33_011620 [Fluviicola sp.]|nr:hypothetical protein [Fluviicola sp.]
MRIFVTILLVFTLFSCKKNKNEILNLNGNRIDVLGHAGMGISSLYPIDSGESLIACLNNGANGTELDVQITKDNVLVAFHDSKLDGMTNLSGIIREKTWSELQEGFYTTTPYLEYKILRVSDLFDNFSSYSDYIFTFDIKINPGPQEDANLYIDDFSSVVDTLFTKYSLQQKCFVEAQSVQFMTQLTIKNSQIRQFIYPQVFETGLSIAQNNNLFGITISSDNITKEQVLIAHNLGFFVTIWGVNSAKENKEAVSKNPDMIQTDKLSHLIDYLY